uniref:LysR transcriptional regulator n=1 Tax=Eustigmatophyceae sp. Ndem 8/9T-3m6.8 TaxID=2506146 RepID=A0A3R5WX91_9STRA|nr:LysR transcriptional regulator [Eustigmatophyceae sp. Ndem 8/9T-3m6.8]QAA11839.1 LysR transcriptional regulator [Eustigmatophyceae sp. Ndem 8/9T-3m6.8]
MLRTLEIKNFDRKTNFDKSFYSTCRVPNSKFPRPIYYLHKSKQKRFKDEKTLNFLKFKQINFELLFIFYKVVVGGSLSKAAKQLNISQPAISLSLQRIEKKVGFRLFKQLNYKNSLILNDYGSIVFNHVQRMLQIVEESLGFNRLSLSYNEILPAKLESINLFSNFSRNDFVHSRINNSLFTSLSRKYFINLIQLNFKFFENQSKFIIFQRKIINLENLSAFTSSTVFVVDKFSSIKNLNNQTFSSLNKINFIEIQTTNAFKLCLSLKISDYKCWG